MKKRLSAIILACALSVTMVGCADSNVKDQPVTSEQTSVKVDEKKSEESASSKDVEKADTSINTISEKAKEKAKSFPAVNGDLPAWKGICVVEKAEFAWPWASTETDPEHVKDTSDTVYKETEVQEISEAGYNFVRVYLDTRYFFTEEKDVDLKNVGEGFVGNIDIYNKTQYENLDRLIEWCIMRDIHVCLDVHSTPGGLMIGGDEEASREGLFTPGSQDQKIFVKFWENIAARYADIDVNALSFNLYNEPPFFATDHEDEVYTQYTAIGEIPDKFTFYVVDDEKDIYVNLMNETIDAVQKATPNRLIFIDMLGYSRFGLKNLDQIKANNMAIAFHFYADQVADDQVPSINVPECKKEASIILKGYNEYAKENNVRWMLQEYGCVNQIGAGQQNEYVKAVVDILKEYGVPYSYHSFNGTYFSICDYEKGDGNVFITPGAEYEATSGGHKINIALRDITSK